MRTTLNIDDDVLTTAQFIAKRGDQSVGQVLSDLARRALQGSTLDSTTETGKKAKRATPLGRKLESLGLVPFAGPDRRKVTDAMIDDLRDAEGI